MSREGEENPAKEEAVGTTISESQQIGIFVK